MRWSMTMSQKGHTNGSYFENETLLYKILDKTFSKLGLLMLPYWASFQLQFLEQLNSFSASN
jgi:hypothetical protein